MFLCLRLPILPLFLRLAFLVGRAWGHWKGEESWPCISMHDYRLRSCKSQNQIVGMIHRRVCGHWMLWIEEEEVDQGDQYDGWTLRCDNQPEKWWRREEIDNSLTFLACCLPQISISLLASCIAWPSCKAPFDDEYPGETKDARWRRFWWCSWGWQGP